MEFKDYVDGLFPYLSNGDSRANFFVAMIGNFIKDSALDSCKLLNVKPDTQYRYTTGNPISKSNAQFLINKKAEEKYSSWISDRMEESDSYEDVQDWLKSNNMPGIYADDECQELLEQVLLSIIRKPTKKEPSEFEKHQALIKEISEKISSLPKPSKVIVPQQLDASESNYVNELLFAYADAEGLINIKNINNYPKYKEDLNDRRIDYYAAVSIERGVMELGGNEFTSQFEVLKNETLSGIKDTIKKSYPNGYEKMLSVMEQAVSLNLVNYLLSSSPYWISPNIKKGVCHYLVNEGKVKWVEKNEK